MKLSPYNTLDLKLLSGQQAADIGFMDDVVISDSIESDLAALEKDYEEVASSSDPPDDC